MCQRPCFLLTEEWVDIVWFGAQPGSAGSDSEGQSPPGMLKHHRDESHRKPNLTKGVGQGDCGDANEKGVPRINHLFGIRFHSAIHVGP